MTLIGFLILLPTQGMTVIPEEGAIKKLLSGQKESDQIIIEGEVTRVQGEFVGKNFSKMKDKRYFIRTSYGSEWNLLLQDQTLIIGDIFLGDYVQAKVGKDGSPEMVQKINQKQPHSPKSVIRRITGTVEKRKGNFIYVKQGDHTEILHVDDQSSLEGDIREGTSVAAQLGEAGYAITIQENKPGQTHQEVAR
jgi:hypothetical protein